ncbi:LLM class flavin-dependent oxidoreductase [Clostridia bacterium OttesenSCG-928-O13]|nr:LLM class flavin-dependent oxidoreductase [Clostridia bacterium OttesenSCG-928-O13]
MSKKIRFGVGIPTGEEGLMYPVPFASAQDNVRMAQAAEKMGFDSVWGNDHVLTQKYVREEFPAPPRYYAPLVTLAAVAQATTTIKVCTALLVVPFRHPVMVAKEVATLDHLSGGRVIMAAGIGAYQEEFKSMFGSKVDGFKRGDMLDETLEALQLLWQGKPCSYKGTYYEFDDVECYPPPVQKPFPIYIGGNSEFGRRRAAKYAQGWLPAALPVEQVAAGLADIREMAAQNGRTDMDSFDVAPQFFIYVAKTQEEAEAKYQESQMYKHQLSLKNTTLKNQQLDYREISLVGSPETLKERIGRYVDAGVTTFSAMLFSTKTVDETLDMMQLFAEEVMPEFVK